MAYLNFDGISGRVTVSGYKGVPRTLDRSISFWLRTTQSGGGTICYWGDEPTLDELTDGGQTRVRVIEGRAELFGRGSGRRSDSVVCDGSWHHVAFTYQRGSEPWRVRNFANANVYVDSVLDNGAVFDDGVTRTNTAEEAELVLGARPAWSGGFTDFFLGDLDEFAIYDDELGQAAVADAYNGGVRGATLTASGQGAALQLWYRMGDDPGDGAPSGTLVDQSYHGRNGTTCAGTSIV